MMTLDTSFTAADTAAALKPPWQGLPSGRYLVVGAGATGLSVVRFLRHGGFEVAVTDSRKSPPAWEQLQTQFPEVACFVDQFSARAFEQADVLVLSPGVSLAEPMVAAALKRGVPVLGDVELFARAVGHCEQRPLLVAITGSNGKSTVCALCAELLRQTGLTVALGGNFGTPVLDLLDEHGGCRFDALVLELSSFQLETLYSLHAHAATVLNISADHMDRYDSLEDYAATKARLLSMASRVVLNADDETVREMASRLGEGRMESKPRWFSVSEDDDPDGSPAMEGKQYRIASEDGKRHMVVAGEVRCSVGDLRVAGRHNQANALAAVALVEAAWKAWNPASPLPLANRQVCSVLSQFAGLPHRGQWVARVAEVDWVNDSKGTNIGATLAAVSGLVADRPGGGLVLLLGGEAKDQNFAELAEGLSGLPTESLRAALVYGRDGAQIAAALDALLPVVEAPKDADMAALVAQAAGLAVAGDCVLLSPACASFDMFANYQQRGERYTEAVLALAASVGADAASEVEQ